MGKSAKINSTSLSAVCVRSFIVLKCLVQLASAPTGLSITEMEMCQFKALFPDTAPKRMFCYFRDPKVITYVITCHLTLPEIVCAGVFALIHAQILAYFSLYSLFMFLSYISAYAVFQIYSSCLEI